MDRGAIQESEARIMFSSVVIGNVVAFIGCILMVAIGLLKKKEQILAAQCVQFVFQGVGHLFLEAPSGAACCAVGILRNLIFLKKESTAVLKLLFILIQAALSATALTTGIMEWLPLVAAILFTWCMDTKDPVRLKLIIIITQFMWLAYDLYHMNYASFVFDVFTLISTTCGIVMIRMHARREAAQKQEQ
jgi:hypothetical protein